MSTLKLEPSPQQRLRLRLALGDKLIAQDRDADALANFQTFLEENPTYADLLSIYRKLLPLARSCASERLAAPLAGRLSALSPDLPTR